MRQDRPCLKTAPPLARASDEAGPVLGGLAQESGFGAVEAFAADGRGGWLVLGWLRADLPRLFDPDAGVEIARFLRAEIPKGGTGFFAWVKAASDPAQGLKLAAGDGHVIDISVKNARNMRLSELLAVLEATRHAAIDGALEQLHAGFQSRLSQGRVPLSLHCGIDAVVMIAGLGCVIEGWAISRTAPLANFALLWGGRRIVSDPRAEISRARPDLAAEVPRALLADAGFSLFFPIADLAPGDADLRLELKAADGRFCLLEVSHEDILWLHRGAGEAALMRAYAALEHETFFESFAETIRFHRLIGADGAKIWHQPSVERAVILALGESRSEAYRCAALCAESADIFSDANGLGLTFVATPVLRDCLLPLVSDLRDQGLDPGVMFLQDPLRLFDLDLLAEYGGFEWAFVLREGYRLAISDPKAPALFPAVRALAAAHSEDAGQSFGLDSGEIAIARGAGPAAILARRTDFSLARRRPMAWGDVDFAQSPAIKIRRSLKPAPVSPLEQCFARRGIWL